MDDSSIVPVFATPVQTPSPSRPDTTTRTRWQTTFLFLVGSLSATILLKIAAVQYLEIICLFQLVFLAVDTMRRGGRVVYIRPIFFLGLAFTLFSVTALILAVASLRFDFYLPDDLSTLKYPVVIAISRVTELVTDAGTMLYLADLFRRRPQDCRFTMRVYFWTGIASAVYSLLSWPLDVAGIVSLGSYLENHRLRGFYNEGGPYGMYLISIFFVGIALYHQRWEPQRKVRALFVMLGLVLVMSASKAAFVAAFVLLVLNGMFAREGKQRIAMILLAFGLVVGASLTVNFATVIEAYRESGASYESESHQHSSDPNYVYGRIAGIFIVPRMIAAHPLTGIGWGNYGLVRNAPEYRGAADWAPAADDPGLGIAGLAADFGLPLFLYLIVCLALPYILVRRLGMPSHLTNLAMFQPIAHLFGAQLNLTYPWVTSAFALGIAYSMRRAPDPDPSTSDLKYLEGMPL